MENKKPNKRKFENQEKNIIKTIFKFIMFLVFVCLILFGIFIALCGGIFGNNESLVSGFSFIFIGIMLIVFFKIIFF